MAVKLIDLQLIYGIAGARDKFEDLASQLVKSEQPTADKVRIERGDGGIDVHVGELTDPAGLDVYQCKFFPLGVDDSQKGQIRDSFRRCRESAAFRTKKWTLCLPVDLSVEEKKWFEDWRSKQADSRITIDDPWGATKLEGLLYQEKNKGLRESFFKEEHLTQIREMHGLIHSLDDRVEELLRTAQAEHKQQNKTDVVSRQGEFVQQFVKDLREDYLAAVSRAANAKGFPSKQPTHWEVVIRPSWIPHLPRFERPGECWTIVEVARVRSNGWLYPIVKEDLQQTGSDWVGATRVNDLEVESWRLSPRSVFAHMFPIWDDVYHQDMKVGTSLWDLPKGFVPQHFLSIDVAIRTLTHVFRFASNLADKAFDPNDGTVKVTIRLTGTKDRVLIARDDPARLMECYRATAPSLENTWRCPRAGLQAAPDGFAVKAGIWFFERFGWHRVSAENLTPIQSRIFSRH